MAESVIPDDIPIPTADLQMILDAIQLVVKTGSGFGEVLITFKKGQMEMVEPKPQFKPERAR